MWQGYSTVLGWLIDCTQVLLIYLTPLSSGGGQVDEQYLNTLSVEENRSYQRMMSTCDEDDSPPIGYFAGSPWNGRLLDKLLVVGKRAACREAPEYPGVKVEEGLFSTGLHLDVGEVIHDALEHRGFNYKGQVLNFYRLAIPSREAWLVDYSPNDKIELLHIKYEYEAEKIMRGQQTSPSHQIITGHQIII